MPIRSDVRGICSHTAIMILVAATAAPIAVSAGDQQRANLFFREVWKEIPAAIPVTQEHLKSGDLTLSRHGPDADSIKKSHHDNIPNDPWYIWSGSCENGRWAISLRKNNALVDLSTTGQIRWRIKQSGAHVLRVVLQLEEGTWLVSDKGFGETPHWQVFGVKPSQLAWRRLDIRKVEAGEPIKQPELRLVRSVGWTDLMVGQGSKGCTRVDWIEVRGRAVPEKG